jgi:uncharacterized YigZ family protein
MDIQSIEKDIYYTIAKKERTEIKIKGSRFIATASYAESKEQALEFLEQMRSEFFDATHNCFAWRIGASGMQFRASDDGEPSGSAGKPILFSINKYNVSDVVIVVTRYYGGTKLGVGGLARAYSEAAKEVLALCEAKPVHITEPISIFCTYQDISVIKRLVSEYAVTCDELYHESIEITANIPKSRSEEFMMQVNKMTNARAGCRRAI